ncbi:MAG: hypothetical protein ACQEQE_05400 [Bacillota bacterium]
MKNIIGTIIIIVYMFSNGFLDIFKMYKDTDENKVAKLYDNKIVRFLAKISGYAIIILLITIISMYGFIVGITVFLAGFLGQRLFSILVYYLFVIPINNIFYNK